MTSDDMVDSIKPEAIVFFRSNRAYEQRQRVIDVGIAIVGIVLSSPVLLLAAVAIWIEDRGPVLFKQRRVGRFGRLFTIIKLRTMRLDKCVDAVSPSSDGDSRVTYVGTILRKTSLDELPQLLSVLRGDMAIVGPRPEMPFIVSRYERWQHLRHLRKPGITGLWQVSCRKQIPLHRPEATKIDLEYVRTASTLTDSRIFLRTFSALVSTQGAF